MFGIVANVASDRVLRTGAKVWIRNCNGDATCPRVVGLSKSGRRVWKFTHYKRLINFRAAWIPENMRSDIDWQWQDKAAAAERAKILSERWAGVRFFNRDGTVQMRDGIAEEDAWRRESAKLGRVGRSVNGL